MGFSITPPSHYPDRITITTDSGKKAENVKTYTGLTAKLACFMGFAQIIKGNDNKVYVVNLRSLGKAWKDGPPEEKAALTKTVKDEFAKLFFKDVKEYPIHAEERRQILVNQILLGFIGELNDLILQGTETGTTIHRELQRFRAVKINQPNFMIFEQRIEHYNKIRNAIFFHSNDSEWREKVLKCLPNPKKMNLNQVEEQIKNILDQIHLP
jgi:hypothetical protein